MNENKSIEHNLSQLPRSAVIARRLLRWMILLGIVYTAGSFWYWAYTSSAGICEAKGRKLTDREFIFTALKRECSKRWMETACDDASLNAFLENTPQCCTIHKPQGRYETFIRRESEGLGYASVNIQYKLSPAGRANGADYKYDYSDATLYMSACGMIVDLSGSGRIEKRDTRYHD